MADCGCRESAPSRSTNSSTPVSRHQSTAPEELGCQTGAVDTLTWRQVDFGSVVLAGVVGGYLMALVGLWAGRVPGLVAIDVADHGRKYMVSDRSSAWLIGLLSLAEQRAAGAGLGDGGRTESGYPPCAGRSGVG